MSVPPGAEVIELDIPGRNVPEFRKGGALVTELSVQAGKSYVFQVNNPSNDDHNFSIGRATDLAARQYEHRVGIPVFSNDARDLLYSFQAGESIQFACTLAGHYVTMHADIVIES